VLLSSVGFCSSLLAACSGATDSDREAGGPSGDTGFDASGTSAKAADASLPATVTLFLFDTVIELRAFCAQELLDEAQRRLEYFEALFSRTREGSDIHRINNAAGAPTAVQAPTADIIRRGIAFGAATAGRFDITIGAVSSLWDFHEGVIPDAAVLAKAVQHVDYRLITVLESDGANGASAVASQAAPSAAPLVDASSQAAPSDTSSQAAPSALSASAGQATVTLADPEAMLDLGGIAKGYIADDIAHLLREGDCQHALLNFGGNVYALGSKPDGTPWSVGIQDPARPIGTLRAAVDASDLSVVTSGRYERGFERDGVWYHHILDARTGWPCTTDVAGASILSKVSLDGDVFSTVALLLGLAEAHALLEDTPGIEALLIGEDGRIDATGGAVYREA
jgi:thiamine biosynthesis lipoprotein